MFSWFKRRKNHLKDIKLVCFDIDNTLCASTPAESEVEVYMSELIAKDITKLQQSSHSSGQHSKRIGLHSKRKVQKNTCFSTCSSFTILKLFNEIKSKQLYCSLDPATNSRKLWFEKLFERLDETTALGISINTLMKNSTQYEKVYWEQFSKRLKNYPETIHVLDSLKSKGFKLASVSDSDGLSGMKNHRIKVLGLDRYFDYIITGDDTKLNKPAPENWNKLLEVSGLKGSECMMVGDHPDIDLFTPKKLGFTTVWTKQNLKTDLHNSYVDYEIFDIKEILDILGDAR